MFCAVKWLCIWHKMKASCFSWITSVYWLGPFAASNIFLRPSIPDMASTFFLQSLTSTVFSCTERTKELYLFEVFPCLKCTCVTLKWSHLFRLSCCITQRQGCILLNIIWSIDPHACGFSLFVLAGSESWLISFTLWQSPLIPTSAKVLKWQYKLSPPNISATSFWE